MGVGPVRVCCVSLVVGALSHSWWVVWGVGVFQAKKGSFKDTPPDLLCISVLKGLLARSGVSPSEVGDIVFGNVLQPGAGAVMGRIAQVRVGLSSALHMHGWG